jgi:SAM-dependent methyltransferase
MSESEVRSAYGARATEYIDLIGSMGSVHGHDRKLVTEWSRSLVGPVLDAGCGPGHWTDFMVGQGVAAEGVDVVPEFVSHARERFPHVPFRTGSITELGVPTGYADGILAWYSLIHFSPDELPSALRELARCIKPGGSLLVGFFEGAAGESFPHAVTTAYYWSVDELSRQLVDVGFEVLSVHSRSDPGKRPHGAIVARRALDDHPRRNSRDLSTRPGQHGSRGTPYAGGAAAGAADAGPGT